MKKIKYHHILFITIGGLIALQGITYAISYWLYMESEQGINRITAIHQPTYKLISEIRSNHHRSSYLFEKNILQSETTINDVLIMLDSLQTEISDHKKSMKTLRDLNDKLRTLVRFLSITLNTEDLSSDTSRNLIPSIESGFSKFVNKLEAIKGKKSSSLARARHAYTTFRIVTKRDPSHHDSITKLINHSLKLLQSEILGGTHSVVEYRNLLIKQHKNLLGLARIYYSSEKLPAAANESLRKLHANSDELLSSIDLLYGALDQEFIHQQFTTQSSLAKISYIFIFTSLLSIFVGIALAKHMVKSLRRRINKIAEVTENLAQDKDTEQLNIECDDDLGRLSHAFNNLSVNLSIKKSEINTILADLTRAKLSADNANKGLELRVEQRTAELTTTISKLENEAEKRQVIEKNLALTSRAVENAHEAIIVTDSNNRILFVNNAFTSITGYTREEALGKDPGFTKSDRHNKKFYDKMWGSIINEGHWKGEIWDKRKDGEEYPKVLSISVIKDQNGTIENCVGVFSDIADQKVTEEQLTQLAFFDSLTGLPNRTLFKDRLQRTCVISERDNGKFALFFLDLDKFKQVNDSLGHDAGDELLIEIAERLRTVLKRQSDSIARMGGDEFTVILDPSVKESDYGHIAQNIIDAVEQPMTLNGKEVVVGCSIGIAVYPDDGTNLESLTKNADVAMYHAKEQGRNNYQFYRSTLTNLSFERLELERNLRKALEKQEYHIYYQPKWNSSNGLLVGYEALLRWKPEGKEMVSPADFIPLLEDSRQIIDVGMWIIDRVASQIAQWRERYGKIIPVAVNVSGRQLLEHDFIENIESIIHKYQLPKHALEIELTESVIMKDPDYTAEIIRSLWKIGCPVAIDDFGTGYSSLSYLKQFQLHTLKVDRSFVRDIVTDFDDEAIVSAIISLAENFNMNVVLEGVENTEQLSRVHELFGHRKDIHCQGYLLSPPCNRHDAERFITDAPLLDAIPRRGAA